MKSSIDIVVGYSLSSNTESKKPVSLSPYESSVVDVHMIVPSSEKAITYRGSSRGPDSGKPSVLSAAASFIRKHSYDVGAAPRFIGFDVSEFLRFVGFDCGLSHTFFPSEYWVGKGSGGSKRRGDRVELNDCLGISKPGEAATALSYFSAGFSGEDLEKYISLVKSWKGHKDAERDAQLAFLFGSVFWLWGNR